MEQFVEYIVKNIVDDADAVNVIGIKGQREILIEIRVNASDVGKLVGRKGRTINAVRTIVGIIAAKMGMRSRVELIEEDHEESADDVIAESEEVLELSCEGMCE